MFNNEALAVVTGLTFIYLLYSLLGTLIQEIISTNIGLRGYILKLAIRKMLDDDPKKKKKKGKTRRPSFDEQPDGTLSVKLSDVFYAHPLIKNLSSTSLFGFKSPAYIGQETFSKVLVDLLRGQDVKPGDSFREPIQHSLDHGNIAWDDRAAIEQETLSYVKSVWTDAHGDVQKFREYLEDWFNTMMDRTTGWYKKYTQVILIVIGLGIAIAFNVDTLQITGKLQNNPELRGQIITQATEFTKAHPDLEKELDATARTIDSMQGSSSRKDSLKYAAAAQYEEARNLRDSLYRQANNLTRNDIGKVNNLLSIGWEGGFRKHFSKFSLVGWLITALAISLGAPFWFDLLNKLMQLRGVVADKDQRTKEGKEVKKTGRAG